MYITIMSGIKVFTVSYSDDSIVEVGRDNNEYYTMKKLKIVYNIVSQNNPTPKMIEIRLFQSPSGHIIKI